MADAQSASDSATAAATNKNKRKAADKAKAKISQAYLNLTEQSTMADAQPASDSAPAAAATPKKAIGAAKTKATKPRAPKKAASQQPYSSMIIEAITTQNRDNGSSIHGIEKYIADVYKVDIKKKAIYIRNALNNLLESGELAEKKGKGAASSFKLTPNSNMAVNVNKDDEDSTGDPNLDPTLRASTYFYSFVSPLHPTEKKKFGNPEQAHVLSKGYLPKQSMVPQLLKNAAPKKAPAVAATPKKGKVTALKFMATRSQRPHLTKKSTNGKPDSDHLSETAPAATEISKKGKVTVNDNVTTNDSTLLIQKSPLADVQPASDSAPAAAATPKKGKKNSNVKTTTSQSTLLIQKSTITDGQPASDSAPAASTPKRGKKNSNVKTTTSQSTLLIQKSTITDGQPASDSAPAASSSAAATQTKRKKTVKVNVTRKLSLNLTEKYKTADVQPAFDSENAPTAAATSKKGRKIAKAKRRVPKKVSSRQTSASIVTRATTNNKKRELSLVSGQRTQFKGRGTARSSTLAQLKTKQYSHQNTEENTPSPNKKSKTATMPKLTVALNPTEEKKVVNATKSRNKKIYERPIPTHIILNAVNSQKDNRNKGASFPSIIRYVAKKCNEDISAIRDNTIIALTNAVKGRKLTQMGTGDDAYYNFKIKPSRTANLSQRDTLNDIEEEEKEMDNEDVKRKNVRPSTSVASSNQMNSNEMHPQSKSKTLRKLRSTAKPLANRKKYSAPKKNNKISTVIPSNKTRSSSSAFQTPLEGRKTKENTTTSKKRRMRARKFSTRKRAYHDPGLRDREFLVEQIVGDRIDANGEEEYEVQWANYKTNWWMNYKNISASELISDYKRRKSQIEAGLPPTKLTAEEASRKRCSMTPAPFMPPLPTSSPINDQTGFGMFCRSQFNISRNQNPFLDVSAVIDSCTEKWKTMKDSTRALYEKSAQVNKAEAATTVPKENHHQQDDLQTTTPKNIHLPSEKILGDDASANYSSASGGETNDDLKKADEPFAMEH